MKTHVLLFGLLLGSMNLINAQTARLQVIHNSADATASQVDVYLDGVKLLDNFAFRTATPFINAPAGTPITIGVAPASSVSASESIANFTYTLTTNETYVAIANGIVSPAGYSPATMFNLHVYAEGRENSSSMNTTDVLVFHGATDAPVVDVVEVAFGAGTLVDDLAYSDFAGYLELAVNNYQVDIRTSDQSTTVVSYNVPLETLDLGGKALILVASGFLTPANNSNGSAFGLWVALPSGGNLIPLPVTTSVNSFEFSDNFQVYPNPVSDILNIETSQLNTSLKMTDMTGRTINQISLQDYQTLDVSNLSNGIYFLRFISGNNSHVEKIIISK
jgi:hypothetical protein